MIIKEGLKKIYTLILYLFGRYFYLAVSIWLLYHFIVKDLYLFLVCGIGTLMAFIADERKRKRRERSNAHFCWKNRLLSYEETVVIPQYKPSILSSGLCIAFVILGAFSIAVAIEDYHTSIYISIMGGWLSFVCYLSTYLEIKREKQWQAKDYVYEKTKNHLKEQRIYKIYKGCIT